MNLVSEGNKGEITAERFTQRVGHLPADDDLERCNCSLAGSIGHLHCGWDEARDMPRFVPGSGSSAKDAA